MLRRSGPGSSGRRLKLEGSHGQDQVGTGAGDLCKQTAIALEPKEPGTMRWRKHSEPRARLVKHNGSALNVLQIITLSAVWSRSET